MVCAGGGGIHPCEHVAPPIKAALASGGASLAIETWMAFPMAAVAGAMVIDAVQIGERFQISHFDAQILAAAKRLGCTTVYSEDLNHGQDYGGVRVVNPFSPTT